MARMQANAPRRVDVDRGIYATITLMSVLIIYDGWQELKFFQVTGVIVGPVIAMFVSHVFSANLSEQLARGRSLTTVERIEIVRSESPFLLLCVPPLLLLGILAFADVSERGDPLGPLPGNGVPRVLGRCRRAT
jgi:hypothetical protein